MNLAIVPHQDDEHLFLSYTIQREKPLVIVITDSHIQFERGDGITAWQRRKESQAAAKLVGYPLLFAGLSDARMTEMQLSHFLRGLTGFDTVYTPAVQGGNAQHDLIGQVAKEIFPDCVQYTTYTKRELWTKGKTEIAPTQEEIDLKNKALDCYESQIQLPSTAPHFEAVRGKSEWFL